ncbi:hypothetical protein BDR05DRAFT_966512 [Suillus weaverae]|nr:hypothetical protein BDR05DRAFT_966512 [Suillus weaverae]
MISTSTVLNGAARLTVTGFLAVSFFKKTAVDHAAKVIQEAERVTIVTIGLAAADLCLSTAILFLASDRTARKLLSGDFNAPDSPPLPGNNIADIYTHPPSRAQRRKRFSIESDTTLVADDDNDFIDNLDNVSDTKQWFDDEHKDGNLLQGTEIVTIENSDSPPRQSQLVLEPLILGTTPASPDIPLTNSSTTITALFLSITTPPQSITLPPKPPDTKLTFNRRQQQHHTRLRAARVRTYVTYIGHLEQLHAEILADKEALLDGWANAMAKLGLTSTLVPPH